MPKIVLTESDYKRMKSLCKKAKIGEDDFHSALEIVLSKYPNKMNEALVFRVAENLKMDKHRKEKRFPVDWIGSRDFESSEDFDETADLAYFSTLSEIQKTLTDEFGSEYFDIFKIFMKGGKMTDICRAINYPYRKFIYRIYKMLDFLEVKYSVDLKRFKHKY